MSDKLIKTDTTLTIQEQFDPVRSFRQDLMKEKTDPIYVKIKNNFPYLPSKYVDDRFNYWFPINTQKFVSRTETSYWINYTVEITVAFPDGVVMSRLGSGGNRKHVKSAIRLKIEGDPAKGILPTDPDYKIKDFDYVDNSNADKAALTIAIKNCQERFGIGADITERLIYSPEQIDEINVTLKEGIDAIKNPRNKIQAKEKMSKAETPSQRMRLISELMELYEEFDSYINENKL
jgi:hypothetical protein